MEEKNKKPNYLLDNFMDPIIEEEREDHQNNLESFELYKNKVKLQANEVLNTYTDQVQHGYQVILEKIKKNIEKKERTNFIKI